MSRISISSMYYCVKYNLLVQGVWDKFLLAFVVTTESRYNAALFGIHWCHTLVLWSINTKFKNSDFLHPMLCNLVSDIVWHARSLLILYMTLRVFYGYNLTIMTKMFTCISIYWQTIDFKHVMLIRIKTEQRKDNLQKIFLNKQQYSHLLHL